MVVCNYEIVFMDCSMPFMDGYKCSRLLLNMLEDNEVSKETYPAIVAVTGHVEDDFLQRAVRSGMHQVFSKPIKSIEVAEILMSHHLKIKIP